MIYKIILTKLIYGTLQFFINLFFGPSKRDLESNKCHIWKVLKNVTPFEFAENSCDNFLLMYAGTRDITYLQEEKVKLYSVEGGNFVFVTLHPDSGDIYDVDENPFLYIAKTAKTTQVIKVREDLVRDFVGTIDPDHKQRGQNVYYLHNPGRCGSTLVTSMVYKTQQFQVLSEPGVLIKIKKYAQERKWQFSKENKDLVELMRNVMFFLAPDQNKKYFIKIHSGGMVIISLIKPAAPDVHELFMYRAAKPMIKSFIKAFGIEVGNKKQMIKFFDDYMTDSYEGLGNYNTIWEDNRVPGSMAHLKMFSLLTDMGIYRDEVVERRDIPAYRYEDLLAHKQEFTEHLLRYLNTPDNYVTAALTALERDSQANSKLGRSNISKNDEGTKVVDEEFMEWSKTLGEKMGLVLEGSDYQFSNFATTVTF